MRRRDFILAAAASVSVAPAATVAQPARQRLVGALIGANPNDPIGIGFAVAIREGLALQGWIDGQNVRMESRFNSGDRDLSRTYSVELVGMNPDALVVGSPTNAEELIQVTQTIPIAFAAIADPIASGLVDTFARPGRNATGYTSFEATASGIWVSLLKEVFPSMERALYLYSNPPSARYVQSFIEACGTLGVAPTVIQIDRDIAATEAAIVDFATQPNSGFVMGNDNFLFSNRDSVIAVVNRLRLPAIYAFQNFPDFGGLIAHAVDTRDNFRLAGVLAGRFLHGEQPADIPVQAPTRFLIVINLRTAREQGIAIPITLLAIADRVIE